MAKNKNKKGGFPVVFRIIWGLLSFCFKFSLMCLYVVTRVSEMILIHLNQIIEIILTGKASRR